EPNPFFVRAADGRFYDLSGRIGIGEGQVTRGIATADADGDGDLDFAIANQWDNIYYLRNDSPRTGASLLLDLRLPGDAQCRGVNLSDGIVPPIGSSPAIG